MSKIFVMAMASLFAAGCAAQPSSTPSTPASLPDARELTEHPLDVMEIPQP